MTSMDPTAADNGMERDPEMVSGTTGLGNDVNASTGGLSGSVVPGNLSTADPNMTDELGADSDSLSDMNDPTTVSGGPDLGGTMGGTGGMDEADRHVLDSDALEIDDTSSGMGTDGGDMLGYGNDAGDPTAGAFGGDTDAAGSMTAPYGGNTDDPAGSSYMSDPPVDDTNNDDGSGI